MNITNVVTQKTEVPPTNTVKQQNKTKVTIQIENNMWRWAWLHKSAAKGSVGHIITSTQWLTESSMVYAPTKERKKQYLVYIARESNVLHAFNKVFYSVFTIVQRVRLLFLYYESILQHQESPWVKCSSINPCVWRLKHWKCVQSLKQCTTVLWHYTPLLSGECIICVYSSLDYFIRQQSFTVQFEYILWLVFDAGNSPPVFVEKLNSTVLLNETLLLIINETLL